MEYRYYEVKAELKDKEVTLFGSYDNSDCIAEISAEKVTWREEGYRSFKVVSRLTNEAPDLALYPHLGGG